MTGAWTLEVDGRVVAEGSLLRLPTAPGATESVALDLPRPEIEAGQEAFLMVRFALAQATAWAQAGHELAWALLPVSLPVKASPPPERLTGTLVLAETDETVRVSGDGFEVVFSKATGTLERYLWRNHPLVLEGPRLQVWRGATDNDGIKGWSNQDTKPLGRWLAAGLDALVPGAAKIEVAEAAGSVVVTVQQTWASAHLAEAITHRQDYRVTPMAGWP
uniref:beta-galactosidase n=1 Tax=Phenylobacterium glaciei TaxID=2803784 RepID=A0A974P541_9CAUL|nr:DUF4981 domain-containing protein [Phenylobacterium glaciei]